MNNEGYVFEGPVFLEDNVGVKASRLKIKAPTVEKLGEKRKVDEIGRKYQVFQC